MEGNLRAAGQDEGVTRLVGAIGARTGFLDRVDSGLAIKAGWTRLDPSQRISGEFLSTSDREALLADASATRSEAAPESPPDYVLTGDTARILVVDDEKVIREILADFLTMEGYVVHAVEDGALALEELQQRSYNLVISDLKMPNMGGLDLIQKIAEESIPVLTVIMTGFGTVETAIEAMKKGAYDYILKPFKVEEVIHIVQRGLDRQRLQHENIRLKDALSIYKISEAIATSLSVEKVLDLVLDATIDTVDADVVSLLLEDPKHEGRFTERMRKVSERAEPGVGRARAQPRRGAAAVQGGPAAAGARQPLLPLPRLAAARPRDAGWSASAASRSSSTGASSACSTPTATPAATSSPRGSARCCTCSPAAPRSRSRTRASTRTWSTPTRI